MAGIAGIAKPGKHDLVKQSISKLKHRGKNGIVVYECGGVTFGEVRSRRQTGVNGMFSGAVAAYDGLPFRGRLPRNSSNVSQALITAYQRDGADFIEQLQGPFAIAIATEDSLFLARDPIGVSPLYYGVYDGSICFASEVKALLEWADDIREFPPGHYFETGKGFHRFDRIHKLAAVDARVQDAAVGLRQKLTASVTRNLDAGISEVGSWLSGGLDSSAVAAIAGKQVRKLKTFAVGVPGAPDLKYAAIVADFIGSEHYELTMSTEDMLNVLPDVIYHLESFDALLVRSSVTNYMVGKLASEHVAAVFSGEGGDELFAGYEYLKKLKTEDLPDELVDITNRLHNTALQRVDRCSSAHGLTAYTAFLDRDVVDYALRIPVRYKIHRNGGAVEKWILRKSVEDLLPQCVLDRRKAKFWEGAGVTDLLEQHIEGIISDQEFKQHRSLPDGSTLNTKEELFYYRIFREHFGDLPDLTFVGRTKGAPTA